MTAEELLSYLQSQGVEVWVEGDKLRYRGMQWTLPPMLISLLRKHKSELLVLLQNRSAKKTALFPLSSTQKAFWYLYQLNSASVAYVGSLAVRLRGLISEAALQRALDQLGLRHPTLRTRLVVRDGVPWQIVDPLPSATTKVIEAAGWEEATVQQHVQSAANQPFDLLKEVPIRLVLYRISPIDYVLFLSMHHIHVDGWSLGLLLRDLAALYRGALSARPVQLPPLAATYADFVLWQQHFLVSPAGEAQFQYWQDLLANELPVLNLPTDRPRPPVRGEQGASVKWHLEPELVQRLKALAAQEGTTLYVVLMSSLALLLSRYTGQDDLLIGSPYHGRSEPRFNEVVGCFINSFALRIRPQREQSFRSFLAAVSKQVQSALANGNYPLAQLVERICSARDPSRMPLFQVLFAYENFLGSRVVSSTLADAVTGPQAELLFDVPMEALPLNQMEGQFDLGMIIIEAGAGLYCSLKYSTELFDADTIARMAGHLTTLLQAVVATPQVPLHALSLLSHAERHQTLVQWNDTAADFPQDQCLHQLFDAQVDRTPDALALVCEDKQLSYRQLHARANQLAHHLRSLGVGPDVLVALCLERSLDLLIGLLAILKAGGAYVPLDTGMPDERLCSMIADAKVAILLSQQQLGPRWHGTTVPIVFVDSAETRESIRHYSTNAPQTPVGAENLAYVIFTSGSTGRPKGVAVSHRNLVNYVHGVSAALALPAGASYAHVSTIAADLGHTMLFPSLCLGGALHILSLDTTMQPDRFADYMHRHQIDCLKIVPSHFQALLETKDWQRSLPRMRLIFGGEACPWPLAQRLASYTSVFNHYGPTETTVGVLTYSMDPAAKTSGPNMPLGRPLANTQVYILDAHMQPVPVGVSAELYIGGSGLARGYLSYPELTTEKFIASPFSPGSRLYKSGDLARFLPDGNIEFLGRMDHQVKIRGFRIELGEIESVLGSAPQVSSCVVLCREDSPGDKRLCAYLVLHPGTPQDTQPLRDYLARMLPDYMLPSTFVFLDALPLTSNGKLDRKALLAPPEQRGQAAYAAPRTQLEQTLAEIFAQLLRLDRVSVHDNFFSLGGHSLLAVRLITQLAQRTGRALALSALFQHPTVAKLARQLQDNLLLPTPETVVPLQSAGSKPPLFCVHPVGGNVLCYVELARALGPEQPLYGVQATAVSGHDDSHPETLAAVAARYVAAITKVQPGGAYHLLGWSLGGVLAFEMARQLHQDGREVALLALLDSYAPELQEPLGAARRSQDESQMISWFLRDLLQQHAKDVDPASWFDEGTDLGARLEHLRRKGLLPVDTDPAQLAMLYAMFRRNLRLLHSHQPGFYPGSVVLLRASEPARTRADDRGWGGLCTGTLELLTVPGNHFSLLTSPNVLLVSDLLTARMRGTEKR